jgi:hypothetical protein
MQLYSADTFCGSFIQNDKITTQLEEFVAFDANLVNQKHFQPMRSSTGLRGSLARTGRPRACLEREK